MSIVHEHGSPVTTVLSTEHLVALVALAHAQRLFPDTFVNDLDNWELLDGLAADLANDTIASLAREAATALLAYDRVVALAPEYAEGGVPHVVHVAVDYLIHEGLVHRGITGDALFVLEEDLRPEATDFFAARAARVTGVLIDAIRSADLLAQEYHFLVSGRAVWPSDVHWPLFMDEKRARRERRRVQRPPFGDAATYVTLHLLVELFNEIHRHDQTLAESTYELTTGTRSWRKWTPAGFRDVLRGQGGPAQAPWKGAWDALREANPWLFQETDRLLQVAPIGPADMSRAFRTGLANRLLPLCQGIEEIGDGRGVFLSPFHDSDVLRAWNSPLLAMDRSALDAARALKLVIGEGSVAHEPLPDLKKLTTLRSRPEYRDYRQVLGAITRRLAASEPRTGDAAVVLAAARELMAIQAATTADKALAGIGRVMAYASVPVGVLEMCLSLPPVAGMVMGVVGTGFQTRTDLQDMKKRWIALVRDL